MVTLQTIFTCVCALASVGASQGTGGWRGIAPLHSTRADVERLLGSSTSPGGRVYKTENEVVYVKYASAPCKGDLPGRNVPADTVLSFTVTPRRWQRFSDLALDESKYVRTRDPDNPTAHYTNKDEGIKFTVSEGMVYYVSYTPATKDSHLRCSGFPPGDAGTARSRPFDFYSDIAVNDEKARLDNFAAWLRQHPDLTSYVVVYGGRRARAGEARARAERARSYLVNRRGIESGRVVTVDGGRREDLEVELYALPRDATAPTPTPTVTPGEVQTNKAARAGSGSRPTRPLRKR